MTAIHLIWAQTTNGVIGTNGTLPWHLPEDLEHFREMTRGKTVIMGRKTWESLPVRFRPLPGRLNIVLTSTSSDYPDGVLTAQRLEDALKVAGEEAWVIGGGNVYAQAIALATHAHITYIHESIKGDTLAPQLVDDEWLLEETSGNLVSSTGLRYSINHYKKI